MGGESSGKQLVRSGDGLLTACELTPVSQRSAEYAAIQARQRSNRQLYIRHIVCCSYLASSCG